jgi:hypothetical protein
MQSIKGWDYIYSSKIALIHSSKQGYDHPKNKGEMRNPFENNP